VMRKRDLREHKEKKGGKNRALKCNRGRGEGCGTSLQKKGNRAETGRVCLTQKGVKKTMKKKASQKKGFDGRKLTLIKSLQDYR